MAEQFEEGYVDLGISRKDLFASMNESYELSQPVHSKQSEDQDASTWRPAPRMKFPEHSQPKSPEVKAATNVKRKKRSVLIGAASSVIVLGGAGGLAYVNNIGGIKDIEWDINQAQVVSSGLTKSEIGHLGSQSLNANECKNPNAAIMNVTLNVELPLVPLIVTTENPTPSVAPPYLDLTEQEIDKSPKADQSLLKDLITDDGYTHATLNSMPMLVTACKLTDKDATSTQGGDNAAITINRSAIQIEFEPIDSLFPEVKINPVFQENGLNNLKLDVDKFEYFTLPNSSSLYINPGVSGDAEYDKSITTMATAMATVEQQNLLRATMEVQAVEQIKKVVDRSENVVFPGTDIASFRDAVDKALMQQFVGRESTTEDTFAGDDYIYSVNVPDDPTTKKSITDIPPIGLDPTQEIIINKIEVKNGSLQPKDAMVSTSDSTRALSNNK